MRRRRQYWDENERRWMVWSLAKGAGFPPIRFGADVHGGAEGEHQIIMLPDGGERAWLATIVDCEVADLEVLFRLLVTEHPNVSPLVPS